VAQLLAAVIGASFFILSQLQNLVGNQRAGGFWMRLFGDVWSGERTLPSAALWPARAVLGETGPLLVVLAIGVGTFLAAMLLVGRRFADDAAAAKGVEAAARSRLPARDAYFRSGAFAAMLRKETRLLWRDPAMLSQVLLRALYIPPLVFVLVRGAGGAADPITAGAAAGLVFMAGQVSASLSWITISAEEAPELLAMSPTRPGMIWRAKLAAGLIPLCLFFVVPLALLALRSPQTAAIASAGCALAAVCAGWINIWLQTPGDRRDFRRRRGAGLAATLAELLEAFLWGAATYLAVIGHWPLAAVAVVLAVLVLLLARRPEEAILQRLAESQS
jgi:ABC-2 type transport system permease protein